MVAPQVVTRIRNEVPQERIFATRAATPIPMGAITSRTHLTAAEVLRFNPALTRQVPALANLYLPMRVPEFGDDMAFWHRPAGAPFTDALEAFLQLEAGVLRWHDASFEQILQAHRRRFEATRTEEGIVMAAVLAYVIGDLRTSRRAAILDDFRSNGRILDLFKRGAAELGVSLSSGQP